MSIVFLLALLVGGVLLLGLSFLAKKSGKINVSYVAQRIMALSALLVPAMIVLSACKVME